MKWFKRHTDFLLSESSALSNDSNYQEICQHRDNLFVSQGNILVRLGKVHKHPVLIVYTDATPYQLPLIFPLQQEMSESEVQSLASKSIGELHKYIKPNVEIYHELRHQNRGGNLCIIEWDNLDLGSKFYAITSVLKRLRDWFAGHHTGKFPPDGLEVEFTAHFSNVCRDTEFLYPEGFLNENLFSGQFYATGIRRPSAEGCQIFYGSLIEGLSKTGIYESDVPYLFNKFLDEKLHTSLDFQTNKDLVKSFIKSRQLLNGLWFHVDKTLVPFDGLDGLLKVIGSGEVNIAVERFAKVGKTFFEFLPDEFYVGVMYPNYRGVLEFQVFKVLIKKELPAFIISTDEIEKMRSILNRYDEVQAVPSEKFTPENFHLRNSLRANHMLLKETGVNILGVGALGSEIADCVSKAGIGTLILVDDQTIRPHNPVRHLAGLGYVDILKVDAVKEIISDHNPFTRVFSTPANVFTDPLLMYHLPDDRTVTVSAIADDNVEGFVNEHAVIADKTVFYVRALRGGKAGRIFRVTPGKDACFQCLNLYIKDGIIPIKIEEDPAFPILKNECNNPIRPASAADLKLISSIASRIIIDHLQDGDSDDNHWIWSTERLESVNLKTPYSLVSQFVPPHPQCFYCTHEKKVNVTISKAALEEMRDMVKDKKGIETGGVLAGVIDSSGNIKITHASGPGPKAVHSRIKFEKDIEFCQNFLDKLFLDTNKKMVYVGEWHSHPSSDNRPSSIDIKSLSEIGFQKEYLTANPAMIIFSSKVILLVQFIQLVSIIILLT
jgi:integrative and conjugative element protein (TIGR02256 family)